MSEEAEKSPVSVKINLPGEALDEEASKVLAAALGEPAAEVGSTLSNIWGGLIGDKLKIWRTMRLVEQLYGVSRKLDSLGVRFSDVEPLPNGYLFRALEGASKAEGHSIDELWQGLLTEALIGKNKLAREAGYISILEQLDPKDAISLDLLLQIRKDSAGFVQIWGPGTRTVGLMNGGGKFEKQRNKYLSDIKEHFSDTMAKLKVAEQKYSFEELSLRSNNLVRIGLVKRDQAFVIKMPHVPTGYARIVGEQVLNVTSEMLKSLVSQLAHREQHLEAYAPLFERSSDGEFTSSFVLTPAGASFVEACGQEVS